jgi:hypothetical protein
MASTCKLRTGSKIKDHRHRPELPTDKLQRIKSYANSLLPINRRLDYLYQKFEEGNLWVNNNEFIFKMIMWILFKFNQFRMKLIDRIQIQLSNGREKHLLIILNKLKQKESLPCLDYMCYISSL